MSLPIEHTTPAGDGTYSVYRIYGEQDLLLYVGYSGNVDRRLLDHTRQRLWWADARRCVVTAGYDMIHGQDGSYAKGFYDALLQPGQGTAYNLHWTDGVAGYWVPGGSCVDEYTAADYYIRTVSAASAGSAGLYRWWPTSVSGSSSYILRERKC